MFNSKLKVVHLEGGLGNQLFQVARALEGNVDHKILLDTSWYTNQGRHNAHRKVSVTNFLDIKTINLTLTGLAILKKFSKYTSLINYVEEFKPYKQNPNQKIIIYQGFWQDYFQYQNGIEKLKTILNPKLNQNVIDLKKMILNQKNSVAIHFRRGDYLSNKYSATFGALHDDYYKNALKVLEKTFPNLKLFIFSDENIDFKKIFKKYDIFVLRDNYSLEDWQEIYLMSLCKHNIIANSTFSWWGAYLNKNKSKKVIYPKNWFKDKSLIVPNLFPLGWIGIKNDFL